MKHGFSLVELSIVLVILGLLTGGILGGQSLMRAAELRSVTTDIERYQTAVFTFRDKYFALPGDMPNATSFWGDRASGTQACADPAVPDGSPGTCNGNGNGKIGGASPSPESQEYALIWQHLANAGLVEGTYQGYSLGTLSPGVVPYSKLSPGLFWMLYNTLYLRTGNLIHFAKNSGEGWAAIIKPEEAWNIDNKVDDGRAFYGNVMAFNGYTGGVFPATGCVLTGNKNVTTEVTYDLSATGTTCVLTFFMGF